MIAVQYVGAILGWILIFAGFGLIIDGATKLWEKAGGTGNLTLTSSSAAWISELRPREPPS